MTAKKKKPPLPPGDVFGGKSGTAVAIVSAPGVPEVPVEGNDYRYLRYAAGIYYTTDLHGCSLKDLSKHPIYGAISLDTLEKWCVADGWVKRREAVREQWRKKIETAVGNKLAQSRVAQLESLQRVYDRVLEKLETDAVAAGTYEGLTNALLRLAEVMDEWRSNLAREIWPSMMEGPSEGSSQALMVRPKLSRDEARAAAMMIIQKRRAQLQAERAEDAKKAEGE